MLDISHYESSERLLSMGNNKKNHQFNKRWSGQWNNNGEITGVRPKLYSYIKWNDEEEKTQGYKNVC